MVSATQVYVLSAGGGEDELQGTVHRVQEQVHAVLAGDDSGRAEGTCSGGNAL